MNILFISPSDFTGNNTTQIHHLCNALVQLGHECVIMVTAGSEDNIKIFNNSIHYTSISYQEFNDEPNRLTDIFKFDVIHAWTPREHIRKQYKKVRPYYPEAKLLIHLEDNEEKIIESYLNYPYHFLKHFEDKLLERIQIPSLSHPKRYSEFLAQGHAFTGIIDSLQEFIPENLCFHLLWPVIPNFLCKIKCEERIISFKTKHNINSNETIICYNGNVHPANIKEVKELYEGIKIINNSGRAIRLVRTGINSIPLSDNSSEYSSFELRLGFLNREELYDCMISADLLIQPGYDDDFNRYRLPSKIPEYLMTGNPVVIPNSNIANYLNDGENIIIMNDGDRYEIAKIIMDYMNNSGEMINIGKRGHLFASEYFNEEKIALNLASFYQAIND